MSTSPSWFDQEKFSRLVKKVGPKTITEVLPSNLGAEVPENRPPAPAGEGLASTARISLVSKPPSLLSEHRALPALPRRTSPMPSKRLFQTGAVQKDPLPDEETAVAATVEMVEKNDKPDAEEEGATTLAVASIHDGEVLADLWQKMGLLNEELAHAIQERDHFSSEVDGLRERLTQLEGALKSRGTRTPGETQELTILTDERDQARKQYMLLRSQFENFKQEQSAKEEPVKFRRELEQQIEGFRQKLEERTKEVIALKGTVNSASGSGDEKLKGEVAALREQVARLRDEASVAQRGLALSQKALHETRETLREATEGTSLSRHNFDNIKAECANLAQQNAVLQTQNDQLTRDMAAVKSKLTTRVKM
jgi:regulator of replication initiation timing